MEAGCNMQTHSLHRYFMFPAYSSVTKKPYKLHDRLLTMNLSKDKKFPEGVMNIFRFS